MTALELLGAVGAATAVVLIGVVIRPHASRTAPDISFDPPARSNAGAPTGGWQRIARLRTVVRRRKAPPPPAPRAIADWCDELARRARSGATLRDALTAAVPDDGDLRSHTAALRLALERGVTTVQALADSSTATGPHLQLALHVMEATARLGGPSASAIDHAASILRQRAADGEERAAQAAQARLSAHVLTAIPLLMLGAMLATDGDVRAVVASRAGVACVAIGLALNAAGWWWMRRLVAVRT